jgi:NAD+ kinase
MDIGSVVVFHNSAKPEARREAPRLKAWFRKKGIRVFSTGQADKARFAVALGGDGTLLRAARCLAPLGIPVLGVNLGRLGFLAATDLKRLYQTLSQLQKGRLTLSSRMMLWVKPPAGRKPTPVAGELAGPKQRVALPSGKGQGDQDRLALNDCVIRVAANARVIRLSAWVDGQYLATYVGDGLILSTPTGSTAYSLAASGPIVEPDLDMILLTPICPHSLTQRPIILSPDSVLEIRVEDHNRRDRILISLDGQVNYPVQAGDRILVKRAPERFQIFCDSRHPYFSLLRQKLKWGER